MYYIRAARDAVNAATTTAYTTAANAVTDTAHAINGVGNRAYTLGSAIAGTTTHAIETATNAITSTIASIGTIITVNEQLEQTLGQIQAVTDYANYVDETLTAKLELIPQLSDSDTPSPATTTAIIGSIEIPAELRLYKIGDIKQHILEQRTLFQERIQALLTEVTTNQERLTGPELEDCQRRAQLIKHDIRYIYTNTVTDLITLAAAQTNQTISRINADIEQADKNYTNLNDIMNHDMGFLEHKGPIEEVDSKEAMPINPNAIYYTDPKVKEFLNQRLLTAIQQFTNCTGIEIDISSDLNQNISPLKLITQIESKIRQALQLKIQTYYLEFISLPRVMNSYLTNELFAPINGRDSLDQRINVLDKFCESSESLQILSARYNTTIEDTIKTLNSIRNEMSLVPKLEIYDRIYVPGIESINQSELPIQENSIEINKLLAVIFQSIEHQEIDSKVSRLRKIFSKHCQSNKYSIQVETHRAELKSHLEAIKKEYFEDLISKIMLYIKTDISKRLDIYEIPLVELEQAINIKLSRIFAHISMTIEKQELLIKHLTEYYKTRKSFSAKDFEDFTAAHPIVTHEELRNLSKDLTIDIPGEELASPARPSISKTAPEETIPAADPALAQEIKTKAWRTTAFFTTATAAAVIGTLVFGPAVCVATVILSAGVLKRYEKDILPPNIPTDLPGHRSKFYFDLTPGETKMVQQTLHRAERKAKEKFNKENRDAATEAIGTGFGTIVGAVSVYFLTPPVAIIISGVITFISRLGARYIPDKHLIPIGKEIIEMRFKLTELTTGNPEEIKKNRKSLEIPSTPTDSLARRKLQDRAISFVSNTITGLLFIATGASCFFTGGSIISVLVATGTTFFVTKGIGRAWTFCTTPVDSVASLAPGAKTLNNMSFLSTEFADVYKEGALIAAAAVIPNKAAKAALAGTSGLIIAARICDISTLMKMTVPWELRLENIKGMRATDKLSIALKYGTAIFAIMGAAAYLGVTLGAPDYKISFSDLQSSSIISGVVAGAWATTCGLTYIFSDRVIKLVVTFDRIFGKALHNIGHAICNCKKLDAKLGISSRLNKYGLIRTKQKEEITFEDRVRNAANILEDLGNKDVRYKTTLIPMLKLEANTPWERNTLSNAITKQLEGNKDQIHLEHLLKSMDKQLKKDAPNNKDGYPYEIYTSREIALIDPTYITLTSNWNKTTKEAVSRTLRTQAYQGHSTAILEGDKPLDLAELEMRQKEQVAAKRAKSVKAHPPLARRPSATSSEPDSVDSNQTEAVVVEVLPSPNPNWQERVRPGRQNGAEESKFADAVLNGQNPALARA